MSWLNFLGGIGWVVTIVLVYVTFVKLVPVLLTMLLGLGEDLPPTMRIQAEISAFLGAFWTLLLPFVLVPISIATAVVISRARSSRLSKGLTGLACFLVIATCSLLLADSLELVRLTGQVVQIVQVMHDEISEFHATEVMQGIGGAEKRFRQQNPGKGFTCDMTLLKPPGHSARRDSEGKEIPPVFSPSKDGYVYSLSGCDGQPVSTYQVTATPAVSGTMGISAFCSDQSGILFYVTDGDSKRCLLERMPLY